MADFVSEFWSIFIAVVTIISIIAWALNPAKRRDFDEAARIPLGDDD